MESMFTLGELPGYKVSLFPILNLPVLCLVISIFVLSPLGQHLPGVFGEMLCHEVVRGAPLAKHSNEVCHSY